jgi:transposase/flagellar motor protein MotB
MNTTPIATLFADIDLSSAPTRTFVNPTLWFVDSDGYRVVFCRQEILYRVDLDDPVQVAHVAVMLRLSELATQQEIAAAFGHSVATQRRWENRFAQSGTEGFHFKKSPGRSRKIDHGQRRFIQRWFQQGLSNVEMARRLGVSEITIRRELKRAGLHRPTRSQGELPFRDDVPTPTDPLPALPTPAPSDACAPAAEPVATTAAPTDEIPCPATPASALVPTVALPVESTPPTAESSTPPCPPTQPANPNPPPADPVPANTFSVDTDPADRSGDRSLARLGCLADAAPLFGDHEELPRAGVLLAVAVLASHGGLDVFARLYGATLAPAFYGLRTTVLSLILMALLRIKRPENLKEYSPEQLGRLIGLDRMAEVKTLRRKLTQLAQQGKGRELMKELARLRQLQGEERLAFLYVDGHIREYTGKEELAKAKKAQRAVATCAATDTWLHDTHGAPLLLITSEMNAGLTQVLEAIVKDAKQWLPAGQRLTVLFDRGGWSVKLFARLKVLGVDIITYRKGKRKPIPRSYFREYKVQEDGQEKIYWLYDQPRVRVGRLRPHRKKRRPVGEPEYLWLRQITLLREDGRQTVIVTSRTDLPAEEVVRRLFRRWRQENYFKYMAEEFALDALVEYGVEDVSQERTRPNPQRKRVARERQQAKAEVQRLLAELGAEVEANEEQQRRTMRGFKVAQAELRQALAEAEKREQELAQQEQALPKRVAATGVKTLKREKKLIVDAIKIIAYQCETELLKQLESHYARCDDEGRTLLHAAFQSSASMRVTETELQITIGAQSSPHRSEALAKLCRELDAKEICYPGSRLRVRMAVEGQEPLIG